jgi:integrase
MRGRTRCASTTPSETRNGEHVSRQFKDDVARHNETASEPLPVIRLHDLRHTHATILLTAREPVHVVSQRLGHASAVVTMTVYAHVQPGQPVGGHEPVRTAHRGGEGA